MSILIALSKYLSINPIELRKFINTAPHRYKSYPIPKRNGQGTRIIAQPSVAVKTIQKIAVSEILDRLPLHQCAVAYVKGVGIKENAEKHKKNEFILKMDFQDFFPSIKPADLIAHTIKYYPNFQVGDEFVLGKLFFWAPKNQSSRLSIGAPSSPFISNTLMYDFDNAVYELATKEEITYTRYADDLTFTTNKRDILFSIPDKIESICQTMSYPKLVINKSKTIFSSKAKNRHITGLVITNENQVSLGRERKRKIKTLIFKFLNRTLDEDKINSLKGNIAFAKHIEPVFFDSLKNKYGADSINEIISYQAKSFSTASLINVDIEPF